MTNHSTDLRHKFLALIERMEKAEDENARLRAELGALKAELEAATNQQPDSWRVTSRLFCGTHTTDAEIAQYWLDKGEAYPLYASPVYKPIRAGTDIFNHRMNSDRWEVLPVYASNIIAQQLTDAELENLRIKADAYDIACDDLERFQQSRVAAGKAPGTEGSLCDGMAWAYSRIGELEAKQSKLPDIIYLLYDGISADGRGDPKYIGWTTDKAAAENHKKKCLEDPYCTGRVRVITQKIIDWL